MWEAKYGAYDQFFKLINSGDVPDSLFALLVQDVKQKNVTDETLTLLEPLMSKAFMQYIVTKLQGSQKPTITVLEFRQSLQEELNQTREGKAEAAA